MEEGSYLEGMALMKVLVTGDRGYIGSVLVPRLIRSGYEVVGFDTGFFESNIILDNLLPKYKKITKDIREVKSSDLVGFDAVIHLSALSNDPMGEINPELTEEINYRSSVRLAKLARQAGVKRFIFSSSCSVYGITKSGVVDENSKVNPLTAYAKSKVKTENDLKRLATDIFFVGLLRNSTVYGFSPKFRNDLVVNNLVTTALVCDEIRILSDGTPWRPLIDVRDLSDIFIEFLMTEDESLNGKVVNIGFNNNNLQVRDLVDIIKSELPTCNVVYTGEHGSDSRSYRVKFDLFAEHFPKIKQRWILSKSIKDLVGKLRDSHYSKKDFKEGKYARLAVLRSLIKNRKIDEDLFWKKHANK